MGVGEGLRLTINNNFTFCFLSFRCAIAKAASLSENLSETLGFILPSA